MKIYNLQSYKLKLPVTDETSFWLFIQAVVLGEFPGVVFVADIPGIESVVVEAGISKNIVDVLKIISLYLNYFIRRKTELNYFWKDKPNSAIVYVLYI